MNHETPKQPTAQLPRYRHALRAVPVAIQMRDLLLLKTIYDFPYCTAAQLSRLIPVGTINPQLRAYHDQRRQERATEGTVAGHPAGVRREILRRLQQLFHAEGGTYVQRHKVDNNSPILYTIAPRAVDLLAAEFDLDTAALARSARNRDPGEKFLRHARLRTNFRFAVTVAVAMRPDVEIAYWQKDGSVKIPITYQADDGTLVQETVIPDDVIGVRCRKTGVVESLLAESDKRKDYPRVRAKFIAYVQLWRQIRRGTASLPVAPPHILREMRRTGQLPPVHPVYTIGGQPVVNFRVLWVAKGAERKEGLRRLARDLDGPKGEASGLFWFTHEPLYTTQPECVLGPVWQKARNDTWRPLLGV